MLSTKLMKLFAIIVICLLAGCAARKPLAQIEAEAEISGDYSGVERYKRIDRAMNRLTPDTVCKSGYVLYCTKKSETPTCTCVSPIDRSVFR
jgi:hypothetical protein